MSEPVKPIIGVIDAGSRHVQFSLVSVIPKKIICSHSIPLEKKSPLEGWFEQDPMQIIGFTYTCINECVSKLPSHGLSVKDITSIGITNQRETTILWNYFTGEPLYNAIVWSDIRTSTMVDQILAKLPDNNKDFFKPLCGLPVSPFFSALKIRWLIENIPAVRRAISEKHCYFGTVDSWIVWNLTGGKNGGIHITDVTNASRTMLMNIETLKWDNTLCKHFGVPLDILPEIRSSSEIYHKIHVAPLSDVRISGIIGNQQADLVGQGCLDEGSSKISCRAGSFVLYNTGKNKVFSTHGLVTTVAYQAGPQARPVYALEGAVAVAGEAVKWLTKKLHLLNDESEVNDMAAAVKSTGDVYFVPAFTGLYAPYWRKDARGIICGLTQFTTKNHIIRATLEAVCYQTRDILIAMHKDCGTPLKRLRIDGKLASSDCLLQLLADLVGLPVVRVSESATTIGAAIIAGAAEGVDVINLEKLDFSGIQEKSFSPSITESERNARYKKWKMAVEKSYFWAVSTKSADMTDDTLDI